MSPAPVVRASKRDNPDPATPGAGPLKFQRAAIDPLAAFTIKPGMKNGDTRAGPEAPSRLSCCWAACSPPNADPMMTPQRLRSNRSNRAPEWSMAFPAAERARRAKRSTQAATTGVAERDAGENFGNARKHAERVAPRTDSRTTGKTQNIDGHSV